MKRKLIAITLVLLMLVVGLAGCSGSGSSAPATPASEAAAPGSTAEAGGEPAGDAKVRVAGLLDGSINDMGWNAFAHKGLMAIQDMGAEVSFKESVPLSDMEESVRNYAEEGYDIVYCHGSYFVDPVMAVAPDYPEVQFVIFNGSESKDNVTSMFCSDEQQGYLQGVIAALLSESGTVGFIGGMEIGPIVKAQKAFEVGAKATNPDITVNSTLIGSFDDSAKAKETAIAFANAGVDVVAAFADMASLGVLEGAQESGILSIANGTDSIPMAPESVVVEVSQDTSKAYVASFEQYLAGGFETGKVYYYGAAEGVITMGEWNPNIEVADDVKTQVADVYSQIADGTIDVDSLIA